MARKWLGIVLPLTLGSVGFILLFRVNEMRSRAFIPSNVDVMITLFGLSLTIFFSLVLILREVTERMRQQAIEDARLEAFAEHRRFLRRLDHELKNPLTAVRAGLGSLTMTLTDQNQRHVLETMDKEAQRLSRLITDLRKLAELETLPLEPTWIDLKSFFEDITLLDRERIVGERRRFEAVLPPQVENLPPLIGDADLLALAVHNLIDNALKYTSEGDSITLQVTIDGEDLHITVADSGIGISPDDLPLVWEELYRSREAEYTSGSGIGLALVRMIVERHYGDVKIESVSGQGTRVTMQIPYR